MSHADDLYKVLGDELDALSGPLFGFAEQQLRTRGAFLPFGALLKRSGELTLQAASTGDDSASGAEILSIVHEGLRSAVINQDASAVAVCEWVRITPDGGGQTDAVKVLVEHERGLTVAFYVPCRRRMLMGWRFESMVARPAEPEVKPAWKTLSNRGDS
jgi:hypothetical protein